MSDTSKPNTFKSRHKFKERQEESERIRDKYPDRIPLIVERARDNKSLPLIDKSKFLVPSPIMVSNLLYIVRKRLKLDEKQAIYLFSNNRLLNGQSLINELYNSSKDEDGFLYLEYSSENTFGLLREA